MSYSHCAERLPLPTPTAALGTLRARGLRISTARRQVVDALFAAEGPVSAEALARSTRRDLASVYRNLDALEQAGIAHHVHVGHAAGRYVLSGRARGRLRGVRALRSPRPARRRRARRPARRPCEPSARLRLRLLALPARRRLPGLRGRPMIDFDFLFAPVEHLDDSLAEPVRGRAARGRARRRLPARPPPRHRPRPPDGRHRARRPRRRAAPARPRASARSGARATRPRCC